MYQVIEMPFNKLAELNVKVKTGKLETVQHDLVPAEFVEALKKGNKVFKMLKGFYFDQERKQGHFTIGKKLYQFKLKQLANILTLSLEDSRSYHIEIK